MELYLTYHKVLDLLQQFQENYCCLNSFGYGNLVDFGKNVSGQTIQYPYLYVVPQSISYDQNTTTYQLSCIFADRLNESMDNEKDAVSDMSLAARQLLSEIWRGNLQDYFDAQLPVNAQPFMERFNDYVAGVALDLNLTIMEDINACPQWVIPPTPSVTPITPTPSVTPSVTPTVTPSATPPSFTGLTFTVGTGNTATEACDNGQSGNTINVYVNYDNTTDCTTCLPFNCFACVNATATNTWWLDQSFTIPVPNIWLSNNIAAPTSGNTWNRQYIFNGYISGGTYSSC